MSGLSMFLDNQVNRDKAYAFAKNNTIRNHNGQPVISKDDDWRNETEWDEIKFMND